jgi:hypothetical protein
MKSTQKLGQHKPLTALPESNYAKPEADHSVPKGDAGRLGYIEEAYPAAGPALFNTDVRNTVDSYGSLGNDGTARGSYEITPQIVSAEDPMPGEEGTGNEEKEYTNKHNV